MHPEATPRTDLEAENTRWAHYDCENCCINRDYVPADFARSLELENARLRVRRYPFRTFDEFVGFLVSTGIVDEDAVEDPEGWDGCAELNRIIKAFDRVVDILGA